jgi:hypothetical protein
MCGKHERPKRVRPAIVGSDLGPPPEQLRIAFLTDDRELFAIWGFSSIHPVLAKRR